MILYYIILYQIKFYYIILYNIILYRLYHIKSKDCKNIWLLQGSKVVPVQATVPFPSFPSVSLEVQFDVSCSALAYDSPARMYRATT